MLFDALAGLVPGCALALLPLLQIAPAGGFDVGQWVIIGLVSLAVVALNVLASRSVIRGPMGKLGKGSWLLGIWFLSPLGMIAYFVITRTRIHPFRGAGAVVSTGLFLLLVAVIAAQTAPSITTDTAGDAQIHYNWLALLPAAVAVFLAFATRQVILALFLGIATGGVVFAFGSGVPITQFTSFPWSRLNIAETFFLTQLGTRNYAVILFVYLWSLGGLIGLWGRTGAALHFAEWAERHLVRGPRSAKFFTWSLGVVFHQGGTISTLLAGTTVRPLLDKHKISKEEASYIVDSTASPIAVLLPFNAFPLVVAGVVAGTIPFFDSGDLTADSAKVVNFFFSSIPFFFYPLLAILFTLLLSINVMPALFGIRTARERVATTGEVERPGGEPLTSRELSELRAVPGYRTSLLDFVMPLAFLLVIAIGPFLIQKALGKSGSVYVVEAFFAALLVAMVLAVVKGMPFRDVLGGFINGAKGVTMAAIILALAVTIKGVADALGTGLYVATLLGGLDAGALPLLLMVAGMVVAFSTGTSFGTFAVLFPVAMPLADALAPGDPVFLSLAFGATISGSIFGDQASPISDTTVLSSVAVGCDLMDHVTTQIPYAVIAAGLAGVLYLVLGYTLV